MTTSDQARMLDSVDSLVRKKYFDPGFNGRIGHFRAVPERDTSARMMLPSSDR